MDKFAHIVFLFIDITLTDSNGNCPIHFATEARNAEEFEKIVMYLKPW